MNFRHAASFGKRQEFVAIAELLRLGYDVYLTLVDDQQIDCIIRKEVRGRPQYIDIQIKARSMDCDPRDAGRFAAMEIRKPRRNFFFVFFSERADAYWVLRSTDLIKEAYRNARGKNAGKYSIVFTTYSAKTRKVMPRPRFEKYRDRFDLLKLK
ncbi:MAG: hypothetical protein NTX40_02670 [Planctomycetota bacterium]|nr:hypothetical protein [Planctomycetota bacterium]